MARRTFAISTLAMLMTTVSACCASLGLFENHTEVGKPARPGTVEASENGRRYRISGGGENMWFDKDAFHFVWKRVSGDVELSARVKWDNAAGNAHKKACLMIRESLEPNAAYVDAALHADGLTSLQFRETTGAVTHEIQSMVNGPARLRLVKEGEFYLMEVAKGDEPFAPAGGAVKLRFREPFYVGLGVCAHDDKALETAEFSEVSLTQTPPPKAEAKPILESTLEVVPLASKDRRAVYHARAHFEAPNWLPDGSAFLFNQGGRIYRLPVKGGTPTMVETAFADKCNNDHGVSFDGTQLAISHHGAGGKSLVYVLPVTGGTPRQVTPVGPSYWHGWSPDGKTLVYCAERNGEFDIYSIPTAGGAEQRLTTAPGLDDGPEYSPDGKYVYFNSERTGRMQIWRMSPDGANQEQVTTDEYNNWFAHPSPDGKWLVFLSYQKDVKGHPANQEVQLRVMPAAGGRTEVLASLFGGQGTINVPSWSPDSKAVAFVSYCLRKR